MKPSHQLARDFVRIVDSMDRSRGRSDIFREFCELAWCAMAKVVQPTTAKADAIEARYMETVGRIKDKQDVRKMGDLLGICTLALEAGGCDFLGDVSAELGVLDARLGQFFTPYEVSRLNAGLILHDCERMIEEKGYITVGEPAAGAGGMILAAADYLQDKGLDPSLHMWFEATELSPTTAKMCYIQMNLRGLSGLVFHGNSLTLEVFSATPTWMASDFIARHGNPRARAREKTEDFTEESQGVEPM